MVEAKLEYWEIGFIAKYTIPQVLNLLQSFWPDNTYTVFRGYTSSTHPWLCTEPNETALAIFRGEPELGKKYSNTGFNLRLVYFTPLEEVQDEAKEATPI